MDPTMEDLKFIGFSGVFSQSFKTIFKWKKIFSQITLTFILPLTFTFIAHIFISTQFFNQIEKNPFQFLAGALDSFQSFDDDTVATTTTTDWRNYFLFKSIAIATITVFSVASTATIVYTIASIYTGRDVTFRQSIKVIPKVWKRLTVSFLCMLLTLVAYSLISSVAIFILNVGFDYMASSNVFWLMITIVYVYGFMYLTIVCQLANVVSVLESSYGIKAMIKANDLMDGKKKTALTTSYVLYFILACLVYVFMPFVVRNKLWLGSVWRVVIGLIVCGIVLVIIFLIVMVSQTVVYLMCKSHHGEVIDPVSLSTYLSAYLTDSRPVFRTGEDIQLGRAQNPPVSSQV